MVCNRRYYHVFGYHNSTDSYYSSRGFRKLLDYKSYACTTGIIKKAGSRMSHNYHHIFEQKDWRDLTYLLHGTAAQRAAYFTLDSLQVFETLKAYDPILAGTIPLDIDIPGSDLDVICYATDAEAFAHHLYEFFGNCENFALQHTVVDGLTTIISQFSFNCFPIEIFGQPRPVMEQHAVRHMIVEDRLLRYGGKEARRQIRHLKEQGLKTEPAFAVVFRLSGDPYRTLLQLEADESKLISICSSFSWFSQ